MNVNEPNEKISSNLYNISARFLLLIDLLISTPPRGGSRGQHPLEYEATNDLHKVLQLIPHFKQAQHCFLSYSPTGPNSQWNIFILELHHSPLLQKSAEILIKSHSFTAE